MTSVTSSFPRLLTEIDQLTRPDHSFLDVSDRCFFLGEYSARQGFAHSATNSLILNFKKPMDRRGSNQWIWKERAISEAAGALRHAFGNADLNGITFVPVPPSKAKTDPLYDDRLIRMLTTMGKLGAPIDLREMVLQPQSMPAAHERDDRLRPAELAVSYAVDETKAAPVPTAIAICDDVLTTGCHYRAMQEVLADRFPAATFFGLFLARRVPQSLDFNDLDLDDL